MRKFFEVREECKKDNGVTQLPVRGTEFSAGYDFFSKQHMELKPGEVGKFWTDVKAAMNNDEVLVLDVRSSMGGKFMMANTLGIIDKDYFENKKNDGNIGIFLKNISDETQVICIGDRIAQGIFLKYLTTDDDSITSKRDGGFGSTGA